MAVAVGFHPNHSQVDRDVLDEHWEHILQLLQSPRVTAVGEVGLDHSAHPMTWHAQMASLEKLLTVVAIDKVLVLHCRGMKAGDGTEVYMLLHQLVRKGVPILL